MSAGVFRIQTETAGSRRPERRWMMAGAIHILNGPNLNLLGEREPTVYGHDTLTDVEALCRTESAGACELVFEQTNAEHEMVAWIQAARRGATGIIINPAAFSYASYAVLD